MKSSRFNVRKLLGLLALSLYLLEVRGQALNVTVTSKSGEPIQHAVVAAYRKSNQAISTASSSKVAVVDQIDKEFVEHVTPVQSGTAVTFPNSDNIRHHVYSFSPTKTFEIPLYKGMPAEPVVFDKAGIVALGCNIHDWMSAYVYVVDTPFFITTDEGGVAKLDIPAGSYEIRVWHPKLEDPDSAISKRVDLPQDQSTDLDVQTELKEDWMPRRGPLSILSRGRYR